MVLSDVDIRRFIAQGKIKNSPELPPEQFGSCSVDFKLAPISTFSNTAAKLTSICRENKGIVGLMKSEIVPAAGLFDPGWAGKTTLDLSHLGRVPVASYPGMRICSFTFEQLSTPSSMPYNKNAGSKYTRQIRPLPSRLAAEFKG